MVAEYAATFEKYQAMAMNISTKVLPNPKVCRFRHNMILWYAI